MRRRSAVVNIVVAAAVFALPELGNTQESEAPFANYSMESTMAAGYRSVNIDGAKEKYREDYDLRSGGRLFNLMVKGNSSAPETTSVDRFHLEIDTPGDEPVSHFRLSAADRERFDMRANFIRSRYEYAVPQLYEAAVPGNIRTDDLHDYDFNRTNGSVDLTIRPPDLPTLYFGYRLYRLSGDSISAVRIPAGDTFLVQAPIDTVTNVGLVGTSFRAFDTDVTLRQEYRRVDRDQTLLDPLHPAGLDPSDDSRLSYYRSQQDQHIDIPATTMRLKRSVGESVDLTAGYFFSRAAMSFDYSRNRRGTANTGGLGGSATASGQGEATLTTHVADAAMRVSVSENLRVHGTYRLNDRSQDGSSEEFSNFGTFDSETEDDVTVHRLSGEVEWEPAPNLLLRGGVRYSRREAELSGSGNDITTPSLGAIGSVRFRPWSFVNLFARYENARMDDPFVVPGDATNVPPLPDREISLSLTNRGSAGITISPRQWLAIDYRFIADSRENDSFDARSRTFGNSVALTLTPITGLTFFASYTRRDFDARADILMAPLYEPSPSVQDGAENVFASVLRYDFSLLGQKWGTGCNVTFVGSNNSLQPRLEPDGRRRTSFDLDRIDGGGFMTLYHHLLEPTVEFRIIDYNQRPLTMNDYQATVVLFKVTKRVSF